jgi:hypothetical protein
MHARQQMHAAQPTQRPARLVMGADVGAGSFSKAAAARVAALVVGRLVGAGVELRAAGGV